MIVNDLIFGKVNFNNSIEQIVKNTFAIATHKLTPVLTNLDIDNNWNGIEQIPPRFNHDFF